MMSSISEQPPSLNPVFRGNGQGHSRFKYAGYDGQLQRPQPHVQRGGGMFVITGSVDAKASPACALAGSSGSTHAQDVRVTTMRKECLRSGGMMVLWYFLISLILVIACHKRRKSRLDHDVGHGAHCAFADVNIVAALAH
jgi:hypothetical protein